MSRVLVIGAGGVGSVAVHKMALNADVFSDITLASRGVEKCDAVAATAALIRDVRPQVVLNLSPALPGPRRHGGLPRRRRGLSRHCQLRAARRGEVRIPLAVGRPRPLQGGRAPGTRIASLDQAHYSMVKTNSFNGVPLPAIALWNSETDALRVLRQSGYADFRDRLS